MQLAIRKATPEDAHDYAACHISCWQTGYRGIVPDEYLDNMPNEMEQRVARYKAVLTTPGDCVYFCVIHNGSMIGFLVTNVSRDSDERCIAEIWAVYLIEAYRGKGYGKQMLDFAVRELRQAEPQKITLWVFEDNLRARRFYEKHHFCFDGTKREANYGKPLVQLRYVLE